MSICIAMEQEVPDVPGVHVHPPASFSTPDPPAGAPHFTEMKSDEVLHALKRLHRSGVGSEFSDSESDVDAGKIQLQTHLCWQEDAQVRTTQQKSRKLASMDPTASSNLAGASSASRSSTCMMLHPSGTFRSCWNLLVAAGVMFDLVVTPLLVFSLPSWLSRYPVSLVVHLFWSVDFVLTFLTGYYQKGFLIMERCKVARNYAQSWMLFDLVLILIDWIVDILDLLTADSPSSVSRSVRMLRLLRLVRVMRAIKLRRGFTAMQDVIHSQSASLYLNFMVSLGQLLMLVHWVACGWFGVTWLHTENWVASSDLRFRDSFFQYLTCVLWAFCQLGVGESPWQPTNTTEMMLNSVIAFTALITAAMLISTMGGLIAGLRKLHEDEKTEFRLLRRYLQKHDIPLDLGHRVTQFLEYQYTERQLARSSQMQVPLLDLLSRPMLQELHFQQHRVALCKIGAIKALLTEDDVHCHHALHRMAHDSLYPSVAAKGDVIFVGGNIATTSYLKMNGRLSYTKDGEFQFIDDARWVAEICLWAPWVHLGILEAQATSELLSLDAPKFCLILAERSDTHHAASSYARRFVSVVQRQSRKSALSDVFLDEGGELASLEEEPAFDMLLPAPLKRLLNQNRTGHGQVHPQGSGGSVA
ncbi:HCN4 [Symbiodinium microadriaticum]|nr:HCN4 [Symbiodinium microadriaticum]